MLITDLPPDIQTRIFAEIYWEEREPILELAFEPDLDEPPLDKLVFHEHETQWIEPRFGDLREVQNPFPNTIASVCRLWRSIMSGTSRFWSRFILDLDDPACLPLDVFTWSSSRPLDVVIKSQPQETSEDAKKRENARVMTTIKGIIPHISSCRSIIFDVKYASSLSPAPFFLNEHPHLKTLRLEYQINDVVLPTSFDIPPTVTFVEKFSNFQNLSLHGAMFMELSRADPTWWEQNSRPNASTSLALSNLECIVGHESSYTVAELVEYLSVSTTLSTLVFEHVRLVGQYGLQGLPNNRLFEDVGSLFFEDVDPGFIYEFLPSTIGSFLDTIAFKDCRIPRILESRAMDLSLTDIPDRRSLKNILRHHNGSSISFASCHGFDDNLLNYLATHLHVPELCNLHIYDCNQFTVAGLRAFLKARKDAHLSGVQNGLDGVVCAITHISVCWTGLQLTNEDEAWFKEFFGHRDYISWRERGGLFTHPKFHRVA